MSKPPLVSLTVAAVLTVVLVHAPAAAQLLPLPIKPKKTITPTPQATATITPTRTVTPLRTATRTPTPGPTTGARPDMVPEISDVSLQLDTTVAAGDVAEGCAESTSGVDLLRFSALSKNVGTGDLVLGDPGCPSPCTEHPLEVCQNPDFVCSPAAGHNHAHYANYARYELLDGGGQAVVVGHKQGYCLRDTNCADPFYTCANQGISAGCADLYYATLGCQYLDVTGIPAGSYLLRVTLDPLNLIAESSDSNNVAQQMVTITRPGEPTPARTMTPARTATPVRTATTTPTRTATPVPTTTPQRTTTPVATITAVRTATPVRTTTPNPTPTPVRTATLPPAATQTATPGASPTPSPAPAAIDGVRAAACQRAVLKAGRTLVTRSLAALDDCIGAVSSCEPPRRRTVGCRERAGTVCAEVVERLARVRSDFVAHVLARCEAMPPAELLDAAGLAYDRIGGACLGVFGVAVDGPAAAAECLARQHVCRAGLLLETGEPRAGARLRHGGLVAPELCMSDLGGADPDAPELADARALDACGRAIRRAGARFFGRRLAYLQACVAAHAGCLKDPASRDACERRAAEGCATRHARLERDVATAAGSIQRACDDLDFALLQSAAGANLGALASRCAEHGVAVGSLGDHAQCLVRQHACAIDDVLRFEAPHVAEWIGAWPPPGGSCPALD